MGPVLVLTGVKDTTADMVVTELCDRSVPVVRFDPGDFPEDMDIAASVCSADGAQWKGGLRIGSRSVDLGRVRAAYYRRPSASEFPHLSKQDAAFSAAQATFGFRGVVASLDRCRYVNHPDANARAERKPKQLTVAARLGMPVPATLITNSLEAARLFVSQHGPVVYKPLRSPEYLRNGRRAIVWAQEIRAEDLDETVSGTAHLFQAKVRKAADWRMTVIGERIFCTRIESPDELVDWRAAYDKLSYAVHQPPRWLAEAARAYLRYFGLAFGCFDFALAHDGTPWFLECNPNGQWAWLPQAEEMAASFADLLEKGS